MSDDRLLDELAEIRELFDEEDEKAEGHSMDDMVCYPESVARYAKNKIIRMQDTVKQQNKQIEEMRAYKDKAVEKLGQRILEADEKDQRIEVLEYVLKIIRDSDETDVFDYAQMVYELAKQSLNKKES